MLPGKLNSSESGEKEKDFSTFTAQGCIFELLGTPRAICLFFLSLGGTFKARKTASQAREGKKLAFVERLQSNKCFIYVMHVIL